MCVIYWQIFVGFPWWYSLSWNYWQSILLIFIVFRSTLMYSVILFIAYLFFIHNGRYCFPFFQKLLRIWRLLRISISLQCHWTLSFELVFCKSSVCKDACKMTEYSWSQSVSDFCFHWRWLTHSHPQGKFLIWSAIYLVSCLLLFKDQCFSSHHGRETDWPKPTYSILLLHYLF